MAVRCYPPLLFYRQEPRAFLIGLLFYFMLGELFAWWGWRMWRAHE
ncbi:MAG TPA: hypothetical protein VF794_15135 [Archangium sp.]|jgi:hypothetical protein